MFKKSGIKLTAAACLFAAALVAGCSASGNEEGSSSGNSEQVRLPAPEYKGGISVEEAIFGRRSVRSYKDEPLDLADVSQVLWAAAGRTVDGATGATRAHPSAGGLYPVRVYLFAGRVEGLTAGIYAYNWTGHELTKIKDGDQRKALASAALGQRSIESAPASIILTADFSVAESRYGERGVTRYVFMDVGGAGQNVHLQAESLGLGTVIIGAFNDAEVKTLIGKGREEPLYIMPIGKK